MKCLICLLTLFKRFCCFVQFTQSPNLSTNSTNKLTNPFADVAIAHVARMTSARFTARMWNITANGTFTPSSFKISNGTYWIATPNPRIQWY